MAMCRPLFAFFFPELGSPRIAHVRMARGLVHRECRCKEWYLIRDNDATYGADFDAVVAGTRIAVLRTPINPPPER